MSDVMKRAEEMRASADPHYNCAQSVFVPFAEREGMDTETALKTAACFGSGMNMGSVCGAVTGAMMALGAACTAGADPAAEKPKGTKLCKELQKRFQAQFGSMLCAEILQANGHAICDRCIAFAAGAAEELIRENKGNTA